MENILMKDISIQDRALEHLRMASIDLWRSIGKAENMVAYTGVFSTEDGPIQVNGYGPISYAYACGITNIKIVCRN